MRDVVIVTTYLRPEYLQLCLEHLMATEPTGDGSIPKEVWVCQDNRPNDGNRFGIVLQWTQDVLGMFQGRMNLKFFNGPVHNFNGNSFNALEAYRRAYSDSDIRYVYLVEDDVLVKPDFFKAHEALQEAEPNTLCTIAYRCSRNHEARTDITDAAAYFTTARDYASIGVCWKREKLKEVVAHAREEYYADQDGYIIRTFPGNRFAGDFSEQDGLIMRVMWDLRAFTSWFFVPRAWHLGWYGYHRPNGKRPDGYLEHKVAAIRSTISDAERLKAAAPDFGDIEPYPVEPNAPFEKLEKIQHFD